MVFPWWIGQDTGVGASINSRWKSSRPRNRINRSLTLVAGCACVHQQGEVAGGNARQPGQLVLGCVQSVQQFPRGDGIEPHRGCGGGRSSFRVSAWTRVPPDPAPRVFLVCGPFCLLPDGGQGPSPRLGWPPRPMPRTGAGLGPSGASSEGRDHQPEFQHWGR